MFISAAYKSKLWTNHERESAQARAFQEAQEYILPVRFDETEIPGVLPTVGYLSANDYSPDELASLIVKKLVSVGGSVPSELVRSDFSLAAFVPSPTPNEFVVSVVDDEDAPIANAAVTAQADNGTALRGVSGVDGKCALTVPTRRFYRLLVSHESYPAAIVEVRDVDQDLKVVLPRSENIGSVTMFSTGYIPSLTGRLNPIKDTSNRTYMYADNIAIDGGKPQPAPFVVDQAIRLEDANGRIVFATVKHIHARVALLQFTIKPSS